MTLFDQVLALLNTQRVPRALIGAAALAAHGVARSTFDIDLLTTDRRVLDRGLWTALDNEGASIDIRQGDTEDPLPGRDRLVADVEADLEAQSDAMRGLWAEARR